MGMSAGQKRKLRDQLWEQRGGCAICGRSNVQPRYRDLDHSHLIEKMGGGFRPRGVLCRVHNRALGQMEYSYTTMVRARDYLSMMIAEHDEFVKEQENGTVR